MGPPYSAESAKWARIMSWVSEVVCVSQHGCSEELRGLWLAESGLASMFHVEHSLDLGIFVTPSAHECAESGPAGGAEVVTGLFHVEHSAAGTGELEDDSVHECAGSRLADGGAEAVAGLFHVEHSAAGTGALEDDSVHEFT